MDFLYVFEILEAILNTLRANGNVLLPVDTAGRVLELLLILEQVSLHKSCRFLLITHFQILMSFLPFFINIYFNVAVLGTTSLDISHLLSHICVIKHS